MKRFLIFLAIGLTTGEKLGLGYLPPPDAYLSGGSPGDIQGALQPPSGTGTVGSGPLPVGQYPNNLVIQGNPQSGTLDSFVTEKNPTTTTSYAFSQTTSYPESYETTVLPIDPVTGQPIQNLNQGNYIRPGYIQNNQESGPYGDQVTQDQYGNKIITIGTPNIGTNVNQPLNQNGAISTERYPNGQYQYGDKLPQNIRPSSQQGFTTPAPTTASNVPINQFTYNTNEEFPGTNPQGTYTGAPIQVQEINPQFGEPSYQGNVYEDRKNPINVNTARPFIGTNEHVYKPGVSVLNRLPGTSPANILSSTYSPVHSTLRPFYRPERPQAEADRNAVILNYENIRTPNGYSYSYDTSNGIHADETGVVGDGTKAQGKYSYIGDDGKIYSVSYTADENGFRPYGDHLPTPPPVPEAIQKVIKQAERDRASGIVDDGSYDETKYGDKSYQTTTNRRRPQYNNKGKQNQLENDRKTAGIRPISSTTEPTHENTNGQDILKETDYNDIYSTKQPFGTNVVSNRPDVIIEGTNRQKNNPQLSPNLNDIVGTTIESNNAGNYPGNQNNVVDGGPGASNIGSNFPQSLNYPSDIVNQYSSTQAPGYNQYTQQYNGLQTPNNIIGNTVQQLQPHQQIIGNTPTNQKDETGYYYQAPNTKFTEFRPQGILGQNGQIGPITTIDNRGTPVRRPFMTPDAKFTFKDSILDANRNNVQVKPSNNGRTSSTKTPQIVITSKGSDIPFGEKLNKVTVSPGSKDNIGTTTIESTSPLPRRLPSTGFTTVTTRRPIAEYNTQTPKYTAGYPTETYRVTGSPGYSPSFSTTPGYTYTEKVSQTPGYSTTAIPSTTRYYQRLPGSSPSSINDQRQYYTPGSYYPTQTSTVGPKSSTIVTSRVPTSTVSPDFRPGYQYQQFKEPTFITSPTFGPGYQYEPGRYNFDGHTYPGGNTYTSSQPTTPGTEKRPYTPGQSTIITSPAFNNGLDSPYTFGMEYGNGPAQQTYTVSTTPSSIGSSSVSPIKNINQGYYQPPSNTFVDEFGRPLGGNPLTASPNLVDGSGRPITVIQSNGNIPANLSPNTFVNTLPVSSSTKIVDAFGRPVTSYVPPNKIGTTVGSNDGKPIGSNQNNQGNIGEDFSGPKQPQRFDPETGYHY